MCSTLRFFFKFKLKNTLRNILILVVIVSGILLISMVTKLVRCVENFRADSGKNNKCHTCF